MKERLKMAPDVDKFDQFTQLFEQYYDRHFPRLYADLTAYRDRLGGASAWTAGELEEKIRESLAPIYRWAEYLFLSSTREQDRRLFKAAFLEAMRAEAAGFASWLDAQIAAEAGKNKEDGRQPGADSGAQKQGQQSTGRKDKPEGGPDDESEVADGRETERLGEREREKYVHILASKTQKTSGVEWPEVQEEEERSLVRNFQLTRDYLPIPRREVIQVWRSLRTMERTGRSDQIDIPETVRRIARDRLLIEPAFLTARQVRAEGLLIFVDFRGSMTPFHHLSETLVETALQDGGHHQADIFYFQNIPVRQVYRRNERVRATPLEEALSPAASRRTVALIISDAGAARGNYNKARLLLTLDFLSQLNNRVAHVAWLNPMPYDRWFGTTAEYIVRESKVDMFPILDAEEQGFSLAVQLLVGKEIEGFPV